MPGFVLAQPSDLVVASGNHALEAAFALYEGLYKMSRRLGITHWVANANLESNDEEDSRRLHDQLTRAGLCDSRFYLPLISLPPANRGSKRHVERARPVQIGEQAISLPPILSSYIRRWNARVVGEPIYHASFDRYSLPIIVDLSHGMPEWLSRYVDRRNQRRSRPSQQKENQT